MLPHRAGSQRMARGGVSSRPDAWARPGGPGHLRKMCGGAAWPAGALGQGRACGRIAQDRKMQREGLGACDGTKHICTEKCTKGFRARAGSGARPESERRRSASGRPPVPSTGQNTVLPAHPSLRPPFTTEDLNPCRHSGHRRRVPPGSSGPGLPFAPPVTLACKPEAGVLSCVVSSWKSGL